MKRPSESDWDTMVFCQRIAHAVRKSDNLRLPQRPEKALEALKLFHTARAPERKDGAA